MKYDEIDHYSIWLETDRGDDCMHRKMILGISSITNTQVFTPHITLVGNINKWDVGAIEEKLYELAEDSTVFDVNFVYIIAKPIWLNVISLFAKQNFQLSRLHQRAMKIFEKPSLFYLPHLSLLYGKVTKETRKSVVNKVKGSAILRHPFTVNRISLWHCRNGVANWERKSSVVLQHAPK